MLYTYKNCLSKYKTDYYIKKELKKGSLIKIEPGIYCDNTIDKNYLFLSIVALKYPDAIITGEYALYHHNLTDIVPEIITIATPSKAAKINDKHIKQIYVNNNIINDGAIEAVINNTKIKIYDKERMLIELIRYKNKIPYDIYKEVIKNYRKIIDKLEIWRIQEYANRFPKNKMINKILTNEVF